MKNNLFSISRLNILSLLLVGAFCGLASAADTVPMTPELASKLETVRSQQKQRVTPEQRKAAADALKAQRDKVEQAKKAAVPATSDIIPNK